MANMEVAQTILHQLGDRKFIVMTGAKNLIGSHNSFSCKIGRNSKAISHVKITLNSKDLYDIEFIRIRKYEAKIINSYNDIYCDQLKDIFEENTGLYLTL